MNVKEIHKIIKCFLLRLRLRLASDGWRVTLIHGPDGTLVHTKCEYGELTWSCNNADDARYLLGNVFPDYGIDPAKHTDVVTHLNKLLVETTRNNGSLN